MEVRFNELLLLAEGDIKWLGDAAQRFEELASQRDEPEKSMWGLLAATYRERAAVHQTLVKKLRDTKLEAKSSIRNFIGGLGATW